MTRAEQVDQATKIARVLEVAARRARSIARHQVAASELHALASEILGCIGVAEARVRVFTKVEGVRL